MAKASPFQRNVRIPYTLKCDRELPEEERTTIFVSQFDLFDDMAVSLERQSDPKASSASRTVSYVRAVLQRGLKGWSNFPLPSGAPCEFKANPDGTASVESINALGEHALEVYEAIVDANKVTADEVGKS